jgi:hypothetical protein
MFPGEVRMPNDTIPLHEAIDRLRDELLRAALDSATERLRFELGDIEMEFTVVAKREGGPESKFDFHILGIGASLGASGKIANERTQKVKLILKPVLIDPDTGDRAKIDISRN